MVLFQYSSMKLQSENSRSDDPDAALIKMVQKQYQHGKTKQKWAKDVIEHVTVSLKAHSFILKYT